MKAKRKSQRRNIQKDRHEEKDKEKDKEKNRERSRDKEKEKDKSKIREDKIQVSSSSKNENGKILNNIILPVNDKQDQNNLIILPLENNLKELNQYSSININIPALLELLKCPLCKGYYRTPYTINECMHTFCRSCIFKYFGCSNQREQCPICETKIGGRPMDSLIFDNYLDSLINILFPQFEELDKKNSSLLFKKFREAGNPLQGDEEEAKQSNPNNKIYIKPENKENKFSGVFLVQQNFNVISLKKLIYERTGREDGFDAEAIVVKFKDNELFNNYTIEVIDKQYGLDQDKNIFYYYFKKNNKEKE